MTSSYASLLRLPGARSFVAAGLVGRLPRAMLALGVVLLVTGAGSSYGFAGAVSATFVGTAALCGPRLARFTDRLGQRRVLLPTLAVHAVGVLSLVLCARLHAPRGAFLPAAVVTGLAMPSTGNLVRVRWNALLASRDALQTAFAIEGVIDEVCFTIGPFVVVLLATSVSASAAMLAALAFALAGGISLAAQRSTEPPVQTAEDRPHEPMLTPGLLVLMLTFGAVGVAFGAIDVAMIAFAQQHGSKGAAGPLLALLAIASGIAGAAYGTRRWRLPVNRMLPRSLALMCAGCAAMALANGLSPMAAATLLAGLTIAPTLIIGFGLVHMLVPDGQLTEGIAWLTTSTWGGLAVGNLAGGWVVDAASGRTAFLVAVAASALATLAASLGQRWLSAAPAAAPERVAA